MKLQYAVVYEAGPHNLSAYAPDLPGCVATGQSLDKIRQSMREAITLHLDLMREHGEPFPQPMVSVDEAIEDYRSYHEKYDEQSEKSVVEASAIAEFIEVDTSPSVLAGDFGHISRDIRQIA